MRLRRPARRRTGPGQRGQPTKAETNRSEGFPGKPAAGELPARLGPPGQQPGIVAQRGKGTNHPLTVPANPSPSMSQAKMT